MTNINYYNINNYQPFFGCDNKQMTELKEKIGHQASTRIQNYYRAYMENKYEKKIKNQRKQETLNRAISLEEYFMNMFKE